MPAVLRNVIPREDHGAERVEGRAGEERYDAIMLLEPLPAELGNLLVARRSVSLHARSGR